MPEFDRVLNRKVDQFIRYATENGYLRHRSLLERYRRLFEFVHNGGSYESSTAGALSERDAELENGVTGRRRSRRQQFRCYSDSEASSDDLEGSDLAENALELVNHFGVGPIGGFNRQGSNFLAIAQGAECFSLAERLQNVGTAYSEIPSAAGRFRRGCEAMENFNTLSASEKELLFSNFTRSGFIFAMRTGKLPDGTLVERMKSGRWRDRYGIVRTSYGPFWPKDYGPLHPTPSFRRTIVEHSEPLLCNGTSSTSNTSSTSAQVPESAAQLALADQQPAIIVFDSERSHREQERRPNASQQAQQARWSTPPLVFESRFECGNLRQARRVYAL